MINTRMYKLGALASAAVLCCVTAVAQTTGSMQESPSQGSPSGTQNSTTNNAPNSATQGSMGQMSGMNSGNAMADKAFLKKAMQGSMTEIQTAQLALTKSSNDQVKQFAQKMIDDHGKLNEQAKPVAQQTGVAVPDGPSKKDKAMMAKLQGLSGDAFDKAYVADMLKDHKQDDMDFKTEASNGQNPQIKDLATQGEPIIASHLSMIQQLAKTMNVSGM